MTKRHLIALLLIACSSAPTVAASQRFDNLLKQLDNIQQQHNVPAYAVVITSKHKVLLDEVRGVSHSGSVKPVSKQAYFRIGSITKTFVSLGALAAQKQHKLKLTDKVTRYLEPATFSNTYTKKHPVTIEQLLEHSAGFSDMGRAEFASNDVVTLTQGLKRFAKGRATKWQPGLFHSYSNTSYGLAGRALEVATGSNINDWLTTQVFKPLKMTSTTMKHSKTVKSLLVPGYQADGVERIPYWNMIYPSLGAINLQPRDMAKLIQFYLKRGAGFLGEKHIQRQETPKTTLAAKQGLTYGYGLGLYQWYHHRQLFYGHGGDADGYLARFGYQKIAGLGYFFVINTFNNRAKNAMQSVIESHIADQLPPSPVKPSAKKADLSALAGDYVPTGRRFKSSQKQPALQLKWSDDQLLIKQPGSDWDQLVHTGNGLFRRTFEPDATTAIFFADGHYWFQGDEGNFVKASIGDAEH